MLDALRKDLLNLTLSNSLLKLKEFRAKGVTIREADSAAVLSTLVDDSRRCRFVSADNTATTGKNVLYLKTNYTDKELETRLTNTYAEARSFIEERGINALYLSIGALKWYEYDSSESPVLAPLLLIPVQLERNIIHGETTFELKYNDEPIEPNYTLERKMALEFEIKMPMFEEGMSLEAYFELVKDTVLKKKRWDVVPDEMSLNLFSFLKLMMYHDLDDSRWSESTKPSEHPLLKILLSEYGDMQAAYPLKAKDSQFEFDQLPVDEIDHILDSDSSQAKAIAQVFKGKHLVIKGPPGTGKSQTIANIIAACIQRNKSVLFVSEKSAALEVVKKRLEATGLGEACLELHSYKANRRDLVDSLRKTLEMRTHKALAESADLERLSQSRQQLNNYYTSLLHPVGQSKTTSFQAIGEILKLRLRTPNASFFPIAKTDWSRKDLRERQDKVKAACDFLSQHGAPSASPFYGVTRAQIGVIEMENLKKQTLKLLMALERIDQASKELALKLDLPAPVTKSGLYKLLHSAQLMLENPGLDHLNIYSEAWASEKWRIQRLFELGQSFFALHAEYRQIFQPEAHQYPHLQVLKTIYENPADQWLKFTPADIKNAKKQLLSLMKVLPATEADELAWLQILSQMQRLIEEASMISGVSETIFTDSETWAFEPDGAWINRWAGVSFLIRLHQEIYNHHVDNAVLEKLTLPKEEYQTAVNILHSGVLDFELQLQEWLTAIAYEPAYQEQLFGTQAAIHSMLQRLNLMLQNFDGITMYAQWNILRKELIALDCKEVLELMELHADKPMYVYDSWWLTIMTGLLDEAKRAKPDLYGMQLDRQVKVFQEADKYLIESHNRAKIRYTHLANVPSLEAPGVQMGMLRNEFTKKTNHLPVRKLFEQAGETIVKIKPVFMMSPLSVAHYLSPDSVQFDYVIFDEASQVKPIEAFGALLRAQNAVIVGDDRQLPPSDFFNQLFEVEDAGEDEVHTHASDMESILDLFVTRNTRQTLLQWHYRSKHESLIALSNREFYDGKLMVLPSASEVNEHLGLQLKHIPESIYAMQKNEKEAERIVMAIKEHSLRYPNPRDSSIGVVAFSVRQRDCIENILLKARRKDAVLDRYLSEAEKIAEHFFVKNLENIQGDERDVILVSICYGRNAEGRLNRNFGPVNRSGGERRLNVLFTRARTKCVLFSNFLASDLPVSEQEPKGIKVFRSFLQYAYNRRLSAAELGPKPSLSPLQEAIKLMLEKEGLQVHTFIGAAGYMIDLAIPHPDKPGQYMIGIECDASAHQSSNACRERDRIRHAVLKGLGWPVYRIWSTDWFIQPAQEFKKLLDHIAMARSGLLMIKENTAPVPVPVIEDLPAPPVSYVQSEEPAEDFTIPYVQADFDTSALQKDLHETENGYIIETVEQILEIEAPVHTDYIKSVIMQKLGIVRSGSRIENKFAEVFAQGEQEGRWYSKGLFLWLPETVVRDVRSRAHLMPEKLRTLEWVSPEELQLAIRHIAEHADSIDRTELMKAVLFAVNGGNRLTDAIRGIIEKSE